MSAQQTRAGGAYVELGLKDRLQAGLDKAAKKLRQFSTTVATVGAASSAAGAAVLTPLIGAATSFATAADTWNTTAQRTQTSSAAISELAHAAKMTDVSAGGLEKGLSKLRLNTQEAADGSKTAQAAFERLGLSWDKLAGLPLDQQLEAVADRIAALPTANERAAAAFDTFGKSGIELIPLLMQGGAGIRALRKDAQDLGIAMTDAEAAAGGALSDNLDRLKISAAGLTEKIGAALAPALNELLPHIHRTVGRVAQWARENPKVITTIAAVAAGAIAFGAALGAAATAGFALSGLVSGLSAALALLGPAVTAAGAVLGAVFSPAGLGIAAIGAATVAWLKFTDTGQAAAGAIARDFGALKTTATDTFAGIKAAISSGDWQTAADVLWAGLEAAFQTGKARLITIWEELKLALIEAFAGAAIAVSSLWNTTVESITNAILSLASQEGIVGDVASKILGVDMRDEQKKSEIIDFKQKETQRRIWTEQIAKTEAETLTAVGDPERLAKLNADLARYRAELARIENRAAPLNVTAAAQQAVSEATKAAKEQTAAYWANVGQDQRNSAAEATAAARQREQEARDKLRRSSEAAQAQAAKDAAASAAEKAAEDARQKQIDAAKAAADLAMTDAEKAAADKDKPKDKDKGPAGTFSAYNLGQMFAPNDIERQQLAELVAMKNHLDALIRKTQRGIVWG